MAKKKSDTFQKEISGLIDALESDTITPSERIRIAAILVLNTTDNECAVKALPNEEIFVLRAKDPISPSTIRHWARIARVMKVHELEKIEEAEEMAERIKPF
jgi:hypothetical protein